MTHIRMITATTHAEVLATIEGLQRQYHSVQVLCPSTRYQDISVDVRNNPGISILQVQSLFVAVVAW